MSQGPSLTRPVTPFSDDDTVRRLIGYLGVVVCVAVLLASFFAYFLFEFDPATKTWFDGLGRKLSKAPALVSWLHDLDEWAGLGWFLADFVIFFGGLGAGIALARWGLKVE
jgi:hypothetical protein